MRPKSKKVEKLSRVLSEPVVRFVSLVSHAATQTPFKFLKAAQVAAVDESDLGVINADISRPVSGEDVLLQKITFPSEKFDMLQASQYAQDLGFEDFTTERDGDTVIVKSVYFEQFNDDVATIKSDENNGVLMHVGTLKSVDENSVGLNEAPEEISRSTEKSEAKIPRLKGVDPEVLQKYDPYISWWSMETDLGEMINEGMYDGLPIGAPEISNAYWAVVANATRDGKMDAIRKASVDMGNLIVALWDLYSGLAKSSDDLEILTMSKEAQERLVKNEDGSEAAAEEAAKDQAVETPVEADGVDAEKPADEAVAEGENKDAEGTAQEVAEKSVEQEKPKANSELADLLKEALAPLVGQVGDLQKTLAEQEKQIKSLEGSAIQRRGVETNDEEGVKKSAKEQEEDGLRKKADQERADKNFRNLFGL